MRKSRASHLFQIFSADQKNGQSCFLFLGHPGNSSWLRFFNVILPAGISFYTFQTLSYIIDVYNEAAPAETNFWEFAAFVSFFPHLIAGPLTRHHQLIPQLKRIREEGPSPRWDEGVLLFAVGLCKKTLLADRIGNFIDPRLGDFSTVGLPLAWLLMASYALQIYFDFSGYSDMAIGLGRFFGIELPQNFNSPYQAVNPSDFWHRWHITLSQWLRDYLYIPLGGSRKGKFRSLVNLAITMFLGGLWHGAKWIFALWGLYHGILLVLYHIAQPAWDRLHIPLRRAFTFVLVCWGWVLFRSPTLFEARKWYASALGAYGLLLNHLTTDDLQLAGLTLTGLAIVIWAPVASRYEGFRNLSPAKQCALGAVSVFAILFMNYSSKFLYFQF